MQQFRHIWSWLNTGFSFVIGTYVHEVAHPADATPAAVLGLVYPEKIISEMTPVKFDVIEEYVFHMFDTAVKYSNCPPNADECSAKQNAVLNELKSAYNCALDVYQVDFAEDRGSMTEWEFTFLFQGAYYSWVISGDAIWT